MKYLLVFAMAMVSYKSYSQQKNSNMTNQEIVKKFLNGFNNPSKIKASLDLLADDYHFQNPTVKLSSKAEFIALAKDIGAVITGIQLINISEKDDWVATFYEFKSSVPGLESNIASEWFRLENGMIKESHLVYDASGWRKFYEGISK